MKSRTPFFPPRKPNLNALTHVSESVTLMDEFLSLFSFDWIQILSMLLCDFQKNINAQGEVNFVIVYGRIAGRD